MKNLLEPRVTGDTLVLVTALALAAVACGNATTTELSEPAISADPTTTTTAGVFF